MATVRTWVVAVAKAAWRRVTRNVLRVSVTLTLTGAVGVLVGTQMTARRGGWAALAVGAALLGAGLFLQHRYPAARQPLPTVLVGLAFLALAVTLFVVTPQVDGAGLAGLLVLVLALGHLLTAWRRSGLGAPWRGPVLLTLCALLFFAGLALLPRAQGAGAVILVATGVLVTPVGLSLLTEDLLRATAAKWDGRVRPVLLTGLGIVVVTFVAFDLGRATPGPLLIAYAVGFALVFAISVSAQADIALLVVVLAAAASVVPAATPLDEQYAADPGERVVVALGDSYISGEGARTYFAGTDDKGVNECRRAPTAYVPLLLDQRSFGEATDVAFLACSGARAAELYDVAQATDATTSRNPDDGADRRRLTQLAHLARLRALGDFHVQLMLVSIGGNDAGFSTIGTACAAPGDCGVLKNQWVAGLEVLRGKLRAAYYEIALVAGGRFPVVVVPYPIPVNGRKCPTTTLEESEHTFLLEFTTRLDQIITEEAKARGFAVVETMPTALALEKKRLCDTDSPDDAGLHYIGLRSVTGGSVEQRLNPQNWLHGSLHPNEKGHQTIGRTIGEWLATHRDLQPPPRPAETARPELVPDETRPCEVAEAGDDCVTDARAWALRRTLDVVWTYVWGALLALFGMWLVCLAFLRHSRDRQAATPG